MSKAVDKIAPIVASVIGSAILPGVGTALGASIGPAGGAALGSGLYTGFKTGNPLAGVGSALGSYAGNTLASSLFNGPTIGQALSSTSANAVGPEFIDIGLGDAIGQGSSNAIGAQLANTNIGNALGSYYGGNIGSTIAAPDPSTQPSGPAPFKPSRQGEQEIPGSISAFGSLAPDQVSSNIATQGVYGGGLGQTEQDYFLSLINRRLIDDAGTVDQDLSDISPIEMSYLDMLGLGGYNNANSLLEAIAGYQPS